MPPAARAARLIDLPNFAPADAPAPDAPHKGHAAPTRGGAAAAIQSTTLGAGSRIGLATLVAALHLGGLATLASLSQDPVIPPQPEPIQVSLLAADPVPAPVIEAPQPPTPEPAPAPPPRVEPPPEPPPPEVRQPQPPPPKPVARKPPPPKPVAKQAPPKTVTESPTALRTVDDSPPAVAEPSPAPPPVARQEAAPTPAVPPPAAAGVPTAAAVTAARFDAAYLNNPAPAYPMVSRRMREEGQVMLRVLVSADGRPNRIELRTSSGSDRLDRAAQEAVSRWRFVPARQGERAIESWVLVPIVFKLKGN